MNGTGFLLAFFVENELISRASCFSFSFRRRFTRALICFVSVLWSSDVSAAFLRSSNEFSSTSSFHISFTLHVVFFLGRVDSAAVDRQFTRFIDFSFAVSGTPVCRIPCTANVKFLLVSLSSNAFKSGFHFRWLCFGFLRAVFVSSVKRVVERSRWSVSTSTSLFTTQFVINCCTNDYVSP